MKFLIQQAKYLRSIGGNVLMALIFVSALSVFSISSALADHDNGHGKGKGRGDYHHKGHGRHGGDRDDYRYRQPYSYARPVYVPPPVYYRPIPSPGINLIFPINLR